MLTEKVEALLKFNLEKQELTKQALEVLRVEYKASQSYTKIREVSKSWLERTCRRT